jgi:PAS domain S-box-containing protein
VQPGKREPAPGSTRTVQTVGLLLGVVIMASVAAILHQDRDARVEAARRQSMALATGVERLLTYELRNLERALTGIAIDGESYYRNAPAQAANMVEEAIAGVRSRHPELASIVWFDANGRARSAGDHDATLPTWATTASGPDPPLVLGPMRRAGESAWLIPVARGTDTGDWLVAQLHAWELQRMVDDLDTGQDGSVTILSAAGVVLARSRDAQAQIGRKVALPSVRHVAGSTVSFEKSSELDWIARVATFTTASDYPVVVAAGIGLDEALAPWRRYVIVAAALLALYWLGFWALARRFRGVETARAALVDELQASADWLRQAQLAARTGVWRVESDRGQVRASEHMAEIFGFPPGMDEIPLERFFERMHDDDRNRVEREFAQSRSTKSPFKSEYRIVLPGGEERWIIARGAMAVDAHGSEQMTGTIVDITERREAQVRIERAESQFRELFERNPLPFWVFDRETLHFLAVNQAAVAIYGYTREQFLTMTILDIRPEEDADEVRESLRTIGDSHSGRLWVHFTREGHRMDVRVHSTSIEFAGRPARLVLAEDVTDRIEHERELAWRATHDSTTRLLTVPALIAELDALPRTEGARYAVAYVRVRDVELVAPTLGRRTSEAILGAAAERFGWIGQTHGFAAYQPSESFVIVALDAGQRDEMLASLVRATSTPVETEGGQYPLETWIGLADSDDDTLAGGADQVIGNAALAALQARRENMAVVAFDATIAAQASGRMALAGHLRQALERKEFELFYQPIRRLATGEVVALEALLRWRNGQDGFVAPLDFIPLCEESGLIVPLGAWVLEEAARSHGVLARHGLEGVAIAVNVSAVQLLSGTLPSTLRTLRAAYGLERGALQIELTESVLLRRADVAQAQMSEIRAEGVSISLDDFGTGFSSMGYLRELPIDYLKIDRSFVTNVHEDLRNASICKALIALAHGLGLKIVAEGVECQAQLDWLRVHGCDKAQGYFLGRPAPLPDLLDALASDTVHALG